MIHLVFSFFIGYFVTVRNTCFKANKISTEYVAISIIQTFGIPTTVKRIAVCYAGIGCGSDLNAFTIVGSWCVNADF